MTCSILISELGLMTEVLNTCMEILTFLVKKRKKDKVDFLTFRIVLYESMRFHKTHQEGGVLYG